MRPGSRPMNFGAPWLALCAAFALHVADEALTGFLRVYNPTVGPCVNAGAGFPCPSSNSESGWWG